MGDGQLALDEVEGQPFNAFHTLQTAPDQPLFRRTVHLLNEEDGLGSARRKFGRCHGRLCSRVRMVVIVAVVVVVGMLLMRLIGVGMVRVAARRTGFQGGGGRHATIGNLEATIESIVHIPPAMESQCPLA